MSEFMCLNTFCTFAPTLRKINRGGGGGGGQGNTFGKVSLLEVQINRGGARYIFLERSLHWKSKNFTSKAIGATREKLMWKKSEM